MNARCCQNRETRNPSAGRLDLAGAIAATIGLAAVVFGLIEAPAAGWGDPRVWVSLTAGGLALAAFVVVEWKSAHPMVPLALFRIRASGGQPTPLTTMVPLPVIPPTPSETIRFTCVIGKPFRSPLCSDI